MLNISKDNSNFWEHPSYYAPSSYSKLENLDSVFDLNILPIINLKDPSIHYRCPKCENFPFIAFKKNQEDILYSCACYKEKHLTIKDLFDPENNYLTFLNKDNENQILGFKCTNHKNKSKKFKYFCIICNNNICKDCLQYHLDKNHDLINLEFQMYEMNKKLVKINDILNEESENITFDEDKSLDNKIDNNNNTIKFEKLDNGNYKQIPQENKKGFPDNYVELIKIIMNDYIKYPNYYHFFNIQNIYNILFNEKMKNDKYNKEIFSFIQVKFLYKGGIILIQCNKNEKLKEIINKFELKIGNNSVYYMYKGKIINKELKLEEIINEYDDINNINILVISIDEKNSNYLIKSKYIICPECKENIKFKINDYKIKLYGCKNGHNIDNILLEEYENTQKIDISKIICNICYKINKSNTYNNVFYICNTCKKNMCILCKFNHDKNHAIIEYEQKEFICEEHNEKYIKYCNTCKINICLVCYNEH